MDIKEIQNLIKFVSKSGVAEVDIETKEIKLVIKTVKKDRVKITEARMPIQAEMAQPQQTPKQTTQSTTQPESNADNSSARSDSANEGKYITVKSPMIGTFYRRPAPDKDLFVNVGDEVKSGTVLCVIEAMKLFNEIESEVAGKIIKILVDDASPVEYDQPLFLVDPS